MGKKTLTDEKKVVVKSLIDSGMPYRKVNEVTGVSLGYIKKIVNEFEANKGLIEWYKTRKGEVLLKAQLDSLALQEAIRNSITDEEIQKWTPDQKARWYQALGVDFGIKYDKTRLEEGESTTNVSVIVQAIRDAKRRMHERENESPIPGGEPQTREMD